jgi:hypothetical protein
MGIPISHTSTVSLVHKATQFPVSEAVCADMADFTPKTDSGPPAAQLLLDSWRSTLVPISNSLDLAVEKAIDCHQTSLG